MLLSYALRNADCHAKSLALRYTCRDDVHLAPVVDMITTAAYPDYAKNPPAILFMGAKSWTPGKRLLLSWQEGLGTLRDKRIYALGDARLGKAFSGFSNPKRAKTHKRAAG